MKRFLGYLLFVLLLIFPGFSQTLVRSGSVAAGGTDSLITGYEYGIMNITLWEKEDSTFNTTLQTGARIKDYSGNVTEIVKAPLPYYDDDWNSAKGTVAVKSDTVTLFALKPAIDILYISTPAGSSVLYYLVEVIAWRSQ